MVFLADNSGWPLAGGQVLRAQPDRSARPSPRGLPATQQPQHARLDDRRRRLAPRWPPRRRRMTLGPARSGPVGGGPPLWRIGTHGDSRHCRCAKGTAASPKRQAHWVRGRDGAVV